MRRLYISIIILLSAATLCAHPHMFIDTRLALQLDGNRLTALEVTWYMDAMFTASIRGDFDENGDGVFNDREVAQIRDYAFSNLANYDYFTFLVTGGKTHTPTGVSDFSAFLEDGRLVYRFTVPYDLELIDGRMNIAIYDESYFCDILYHERSPITVAGAAAEWEIVENRQKRINYGGNVSVARDGKEYSGTAYPQQLELRLE